MLPVATFLAGIVIGICLGIAGGIYLVLGTLSMKAVEERESEGYS